MKKIMKKLFLFAFLLLLLINAKIYSLDTAAVKYYPLAVGNSWTYIHSSYPIGGSYRYKESITGTISTNGHQYYIRTTFRNGYSPVDEYVRIDSTNNNILIYNPAGCSWHQNEVNGDSLGARLGDSSRLSCGNYYRMTDTSSFIVFGVNRKGKVFSWTDYFEHGRARLFARSIGLVYDHETSPFSPISVDLLGGNINGVLYGDTSLTGINQISSELPGKFSLLQNYPNPFNPITNIKFQIANSSNAKLIVYDALGKEVATIVDKKLEPGEYETEFDGTNLPSGVYYYKLVVGENTNNGGFTETKKMVLIK